MVDAVAGTTRDPVDELIELGGTTWRFVDTAGIRRRFRESQGADYYATLRTAGALDRAEVAVVLVDASEPLTEQDLRIITMVIEAGRALVIAYNKWDLTDEERRHYLEREIERQLYGARWAPRVNISAATGRHVEKLVPAIEQALASWEKRVTTGQLNAFLAQLVAATPPPMRGGRQPRILFATQAGTKPPHFVLFTTGFLEETYRRFIERRLREEFGFEGTPIKVSMRLREKRGKGGSRPVGKPARPAARRYGCPAAPVTRRSPGQVLVPERALVLGLERGRRDRPALVSWPQRHQPRVRPRRTRVGGPVGLAGRLR